LCEWALVFVLLLFNPFELVSVRLCRDGGETCEAEGSPIRANCQGAKRLCPQFFLN
jgi:hypothetical protein